VVSLHCKTTIKVSTVLTLSIEGSCRLFYSISAIFYLCWMLFSAKHDC
jgi:hypothetical protein